MERKEGVRRHWDEPPCGTLNISATQSRSRACVEAVEPIATEATTSGATLSVSTLTVPSALIPAARMLKGRLRVFESVARNT